MGSNPISSTKIQLYAGISNSAARRIHLEKQFAKNPGKPIQTHATCSAPSLSPPAPKGRRETSVLSLEDWLGELGNSRPFQILL